LRDPCFCSNGAERGRERERIEGRNDGRNRNRDGELLVELPGQPADERRRDEDRAQHQRGRDDGAGYFAHGAPGRLVRFQTKGDVSFDVFHDDNCVIDDNADSQHQAEERKIVDGKSQPEHDGEGPDQRHGHGRERDDGRAPRLQKENNNNHDQEDRFNQRVNDGLDGMPHEHGRIIDDRKIDALGKILFQFLHGVTDIGGKLQGVGAGQLEDGNRHRRFIIQQRAQRVTVRADLHAGHVLQKSFLSVGADLDNDLAEFLGGCEAALGVDLQFKIGRLLDWLLANRARRNLHVLLADGGHDVAGRQVAFRDLVRLQPDAHRVIARTKHLHAARAGNARQHILDLQSGVIAQINVVIHSVGRK